MTAGIAIISPPCLEATPERRGRAWQLARAGAALEDAGLAGRLEALGARVDGIRRPLLAAEAVTSDQIVNLGRFNALVAREVQEALASGSRPLLAGGSCSHLPGMIAGIQQASHPAARIGLLWFDAHGDFNTPATTPSGMLGGMPVAVTAGLCHAYWREGAGMVGPLPTNRIMMVDVRNLDPPEEALIRATDVEIVRLSADRRLDAAIDRVRAFADSVDRLYLHVDVDVLDAALQPNHPTVEPDGLDVAETLALIEAAMQSGNVSAFGVVSINPEEPGGTVSLASAMALIEGGVTRWLPAPRV